MQATVYKSTGSWYILKASDGAFINARIKGKFKIDGRTSSNPIAVGDIVNYDIENDVEQTGIIHTIQPRNNYINRQSPANKHSHHIIASNLTQCLLFATLRDPKTSLGFIDRFLITAEAYRIPAIIVYNKADVYDETLLEYYKYIKNIYTKIGYQVQLVSLVTQQGLAQLQATLTNQVTLLSGHSGVGKSTFINYLYPQLNITTQEVSDWSGKGLHTTTFAQMYDLPQGGAIIDTPGIRELGLVDIKKQELGQYFPEIRAAMQHCKFTNCLHYNETVCGVKSALNAGVISEERYLSYLTLMEAIVEIKY